MVIDENGKEIENPLFGQNKVTAVMHTESNTEDNDVFGSKEWRE